MKKTIITIILTIVTTLVVLAGMFYALYEGLNLTVEITDKPCVFMAHTKSGGLIEVRRTNDGRYIATVEYEKLIDTDEVKGFTSTGRVELTLPEWTPEMESKLIDEKIIG